MKELIKEKRVHLLIIIKLLFYTGPGFLERRISRYALFHFLVPGYYNYHYQYSLKISTGYLCVGWKKGYPIPLLSFWFPLLSWPKELNLVLHLALFCGHFWHGGDSWACLVLSIACCLVEDLAIDVLRSWETYPTYGSLALRVHWFAPYSSSSSSWFLFSL